MTAKIITGLILIFSLFPFSYAHRYFSQKAIAIFTFMSVLVSLCSVSYAHGTGYRQSSQKAIALEFAYSTGEAMSYREARVYSPNDEKFAYQSGRTDEKGRFAFVPDVKGEWRVIVRDEEGHQCEAKIDVTDEILAGKDNLTIQSDSGNDIFIRALLGVSIIFNIALVIRRRKNAHQ